MRTSLRLSILFLVILLISGCKKFDKKTQFDLAINESFTIPSTIGISIPFISIPTPPTQTNIDQELEIQEKKKKKIESIILTDLKLTITNPFYETFSFLNDIEISISADGLPKILVAEKNNIPASTGAELIINPVANVELEQYIKQDFVDIHVQITTDETILQDIDVDLSAVFFVDVKVFGV